MWALLDSNKWCQLCAFGSINTAESLEKAIFVSIVVSGALAFRVLLYL
jgi:hypothetical protein